MSDNKVDISEVDDFSNDLQEASSDIRSQLDKVKESIETINSMDSFSGKAAKEAKSYFSELHLTILESFRGLFNDLEGNLKQHLDTFESEVDSSDSAVIRSNYLQDVKEEVNNVFADLEKQDESIADTIKDVSDISSATPPSFSDVNEWKKKAIKKLEELDDDLESFTGEGDETDVKGIMNQIETAMNNAKTSEGKARFADFKGASNMKELTKLQDYNENKQDERMEKAKDARDSALQGQNKHSSRDVLNKAYEEYENGDIKYDQYTAILDQVGKTDGNMSEEQLEEETTKKFMSYLKDHEMLEKYLDDHQPLAEYTVTKTPKMLFEFGGKYAKIFLEKSGISREKLADYLLEAEKDVSSRTKVADLNFYKEIKETYKQSDKLLAYSKYAKWGGKALGGAGVGLTFFDDIVKEDKTVGEATAHGGAALAIGGAITLASNPGGWAIAAGIGATAGFEFLYSHNVLNIQDGLDKAGKKLSEWGNSFKETAGEALDNSVIASINPFS